MRSPDISSVQYAPGAIPADPQDLILFFTAELQRISSAIQALAMGHLDESFVVPKKPRDGDIRFADGTTWNPGSGKGFYSYFGAAWHLLSSSVTFRAPYLTVAPGSPTLGDIVFADGTSWNPGSGRGVYARDTATWRFLG